MRDPTHPLPDDRQPKAPPTRPVIETNYQKLRALVAWLNLSETATALELGVSTILLRGLLNGRSLPDLETMQRIYVMSRRWPHGLIDIEGWPKPSVLDRRIRSKDPVPK